MRRASAGHAVHCLARAHASRRDGGRWTGNSNVFSRFIHLATTLYDKVIRHGYHEGATVLGSSALSAPSSESLTTEPGFTRCTGPRSRTTRGIPCVVVPAPHLSNNYLPSFSVLDRSRRWAPPATNAHNGPCLLWAYIAVGRRALREFQLRRVLLALVS